MRTSNFIKITLVSASMIAVITQSPAQSVEFANARSMGMARASMVSARGIDAIGLNPANLGLADRSPFSVSIFPLGVHIGTNFITYERYKAYFTGTQTDSGKVGRYLSESDKEDILNYFPEGMGKMASGGAITLFAMTYIDENLGGFAFTVNERFGASASIPRDYLRLLLYGNPLGSTYDFSGTEANGEWLREYAISYGRQLPSFLQHTTISVGVSLKLLHGFAFGSVDEFSAMVTTDPNSALTGTAKYRGRSATIDAINDTTHSGFVLFPAPAGTGFGFDLGATAHIGQAFWFGMSVIDVGSMTWTRNTREYRGDTSVTITDLTTQAKRDSITDTFKSKEYPVESFNTSLPSVLRCGVAVDVQQLPFMKAMPGQMVVELDYIQGLNSFVGNTTSPRFALGVDYHLLRWLPIRTGFAFGGSERVHWGLGSGVNLDGFDFEIGTEDIIAILAPSVMSTASLAIGMRLRF
ncbi:MAG: DUF5723 family protein [Bacteroidota bacterium]